MDKGLNIMLGIIIFLAIYSCFSNIQKTAIIENITKERDYYRGLLQSYDDVGFNNIDL